MAEPKPVRAWAAAWDSDLLEHTCRRTRREVMEIMAGAWRTYHGQSVASAWAKARRRGCRIIRVEIRPLADTEREER